MDNLKKFELKKKQLVKEFNELKKQGPIRIEKKTSNLFRSRNKINKPRLNVRSFNEVISIDSKNKIVNVEGMTTYEDLVNETLKYNFMPSVVPQLKTITVGGAYTGGGIESTSFKYGFVHETVLEAEILLSSGKTIICNAKQNSDLFFGYPNSYGTLGYVLRLKIKLIPIKKFVHLTYIKINPEKMFHKMNEIEKKGNLDFLDGVVFSEEESYIIVGKFTDKAPYTNNYTYMKIFYKSIKNRNEDYLTTNDYLWRWDTDWFWCSEHFLVQKPIIRFFWGKRNLNSKTYHKIMSLNAKYKLIDKLPIKKIKSESVIQDVEIPLENAYKFLEFFMKTIKIWPIWICPTKTYNKSVKFDLYITNPDKLYFNFGFWDQLQLKGKEKEGYYNRLIEKKVLNLNGKKSLYSSSYFPEKEFWKVYNGKKYFELKNKYDKNKVFLNLYEKCVLKK